MILRQHLNHDPVVAASYVFGRGGKNIATMCDPVDDPSSGSEPRRTSDLHIHRDARRDPGYHDQSRAVAVTRSG